MSRFSVDQLPRFVDGIFVFSGLSLTADIKFSPQKLSISAMSPIHPHCIIALQFLPQFFTEYFCYQRMDSWIYPRTFYSTMFNMEQTNFSSMAFSFSEPLPATLTFSTPNGITREHELILFPSDEVEDPGEINLANFVSMDSEQFRHLVTVFDRSDYVYVTLTRTRVQFQSAFVSYTLTTQSGQCIIGGVGERDRIRLVITFRPSITFYNFLCQTKTVWIFGTQHSNKAVISAPTGLDATYLVYLPSL